ncbi:hypothetical protein H8356DRAFT_1434044 [Neocallimastix lanati (nom. inval.)]|nr:hypothetical protein H8356DRAFT_1434044 [Neocallimastix sp. JGI-2020a]
MQSRYSSYFSGYRVFEVISKSIIIVRDSYFNESILGSVGTSFFHSLNPSDKQIEGKQINLEDNIDLMDEYNNENQKLTENQEEIIKNFKY